MLAIDDMRNEVLERQIASWLNERAIAIRNRRIGDDPLDLGDGEKAL
ncbi:hypothetical protein ACLBKU_10350 [Erythrobacter sp. NE805]